MFSIYKCVSGGFDQKIVVDVVKIQQIINIGAVSNIINYPFIQISQCWNIGLNRTQIAKNNIENGLVTIKIVRKELLHLIVWPIDQQFIFQYGGHLGNEPEKVPSRFLRFVSFFCVNRHLKDIK